MNRASGTFRGCSELKPRVVPLAPLRATRVTRLPAPMVLTDPVNVNRGVSQSTALTETTLKSPPCFSRTKVCILIHTEIHTHILPILPEKSITASILWDRFGLGISTICAIHCLLFPVLIAVLPLASTAPFLEEWLHPIFVALIAPTVYFASKRSHYDRKITGLLVSGFVLILFGWLLGHYWLGFWVETGSTLAGSLLLIRGHWLNYRHHQTCTVSSHKHHPVEMDEVAEPEHKPEHESVS
jgi:hypothetical protein